MKQLLEFFVHPWLVQQPVKAWSYVGGHEATQRDQSNSEQSALKVIMEELGRAPFRRGPISWPARRDALSAALSRTRGVVPWVRINPNEAALLVRALDGGWSYPTDALGRVRRDKPDKRSRFDHLGDAFSHGCATLLQRTDASSRTVQSPLERAALVKRFSGYVGYAGAGSRTGA